MPVKELSQKRPSHQNKTCSKISFQTALHTSQKQTLSCRFSVVHVHAASAHSTLWCPRAEVLTDANCCELLCQSCLHAARKKRRERGHDGRAKHLFSSTERTARVDAATKKDDAPEFDCPQLQQSVAERVALFERAGLDMKSAGLNVELTNTGRHLFERSGATRTTPEINRVRFHCDSTWSDQAEEDAATATCLFHMLHRWSSSTES